jgi:hypothetical protein
MKSNIVVICMMLSLIGCASKWELTINDYMEAADKVNLGDSKEKVLSLLQPTQKRLDTIEIKQSDKYMKDGVLVEIIYFRSGWQSDGLITDDEFTPYVFNDGKLVAIGWQYIGGPKSQGQASD